MKHIQEYTRQAIVCIFKGATDHTGSRVIAKCDAGRVVVPWDHSLSVFENHRAAAVELCAKLEWNHKQFVGGSIPEGYVFVDVSVMDK